MRFSFSSLKRVRMCPVSVHLAQHQVMTDQSSRGSALHQFLAMVPEVGRADALLMVPAEHRRACEVLDLSKLPACRPDAWEVEVTFAYDAEAGSVRRLGTKLTREQMRELALPGEVLGTLDVLGQTEDAVVVLDYKSGWKDLGPVADNDQLRGYSLCAALYYGKAKAVQGIIRLKEDGDSYSDYAELGAADIANTMLLISNTVEAIDQARAQLDGGELRTHQGDWCTYCPAFPTCPAKMALAAALTQRVEQKSRWELSLPPLTKETAPEVLEQVKLAQQVVDHVKAQLDIYALENPFELGGGWWYGTRPYPADHIDPARALPIIERLADAETARASVKEVRMVQKGLLEEAIRGLKARKPGVKLGATKAAILEALEKEGAITRTFTYPVGRHRRAAELPEGSGGSDGKE